GNADLAIPDTTALSRLRESLDRGTNHFGDQNHFGRHFREKLHDIASAALEFGLTLLAAKALGSRDGNALPTDFLESVPQFVDRERLNNCLDLCHGSADSD